MADYLLTDKLESALKEVLFDVMPILVATSESSIQDKPLPNVTCIADGDNQDEYPKGTGNFWVNAVVELRTGAAQDTDGQGIPTDPLADRQTLLTTMSNTLLVDNIWTLLSEAVTDFTVFPEAVIFQSPQVDRSEVGVWIDRIPMRVLCCASDIS